MESYIGLSKYIKENAMKNNITTFILVTFLSMLSVSANAEMLSEGNWKSDSFFITLKGGWSIEDEGGKSYVVLNDSFKASEAPDLKIFFSKKSPKEINGKNASGSSHAAFVVKIDDYSGAARYQIPSDINWKEYQTIVIHCEEFSKLWGTSPIKQ